MPRKKTEFNDKFDTVFPTRLRSIMEESKTTQQTLAVFLGKSRQAVAFYCDGSSTPDWETIAKIACYFKVTSDWLLGLTDVRSSDTTLQAICSYTGLSEYSVESLHGFAISSKTLKPSRTFLDGLNLLMKNIGFIVLCSEIKVFCDDIAKDIEYHRVFKAIAQGEHNDLDYLRISEEDEMEKYLQKQLVDRNPEYRGKSTVLVGSGRIEYAKHLILDEFSQLLKEISNYETFHKNTESRNIFRKW